MKIRLPESLTRTAKTLLSHGFQSHLVGGAVRDILLSRPVKDYDIATDALPHQVMQLFRRVIPTGIKHGTVTVLMPDAQYEVTTFRTEGEYSDHRRPDSVTWAPDITADLQRRDFTMNAITWDFSAQKIFDPFDGRHDLTRRTVRAIGDPNDRFTEDALRMLRAIRFATELSFSIDPETCRAINRNAALIKKIASERIRDELERILAAASGSKGFLLLNETELLPLLIPELKAAEGVRQPSLHKFDVFIHSLHALDSAPRDNQIVRLAALFHDIGKPSTIARNRYDELCFHGHENVGADLTAKILTRLRFPHRTVENVCHLIRQHMFHYDESWTDAAVRRFVKRVGRENIANLFELRRADQFALQALKTDARALLDFQKRIDAVLAHSTALSLKELAIGGTEIMEALALAPGPTIGVILDHLLEAVLDDPAMNTKEKLLALAQGFYKHRIRN